jgi:hypothetical protein
MHFVRYPTVRISNGSSKGVVPAYTLTRGDKNVTPCRLKGRASILTLQESVLNAPPPGKTCGHASEAGRAVPGLGVSEIQPPLPVGIRPLCLILGLFSACFVRSVQGAELNSVPFLGRVPVRFGSIAFSVLPLWKENVAQNSWNLACNRGSQHPQPPARRKNLCHRNAKAQRFFRAQLRRQPGLASSATASRPGSTYRSYPGSRANPFRGLRRSAARSWSFPAFLRQGGDVRVFAFSLCWQP